MTITSSFSVRLLTAFSLAVGCLLGGAEGNDVLRTARQIRALRSADADARRPVELSGVVLGQAEPDGESLVLCDETDSIYVLGSAEEIRSLIPGDRIELSGCTIAGDFAPYVEADSIRKVGSAALPEPARVSSDDLFTKGLDAQWIAVSGIVRDLHSLPTEDAPNDLGAGPTAVQQRRPFSGWKMTLAIGDRLVPVQFFDRVDPEQYIDAEVEIRGLCFNLHNAERQFLLPLILVPRGVAMKIVREPPAGPFDLPAISSRSLFRFHPEGLSTHRVHIEGVVLYQLPGTGIWIRDDGHGFFARSSERIPLEPGDRVQVAGFPERGEFAPVLSHAIYRKTGRQADPDPVRLLHREQAAVHNGDLVTVDGVLVDRMKTRQGMTLRILARDENVEALCSGPSTTWDAVDAEPGSVVSVAGICLLSVEHALPPSGVLLPDKFSLLVRRPADIVVLKPAPWWTPQRVAVLLAGVIATLLAVLVAVFLASRRRLSKERELRAIQASTYSARLAERSRMARNLHDTIAQGLGAISLQLELTGANLRSADPDASAGHLNLAQQLVRSSMTEVRSFIRNLRTKTQQDGDLASALKELLHLAVEGTSIEANFSVEGNVFKLAPGVEAQIIRVTQEAVSNAVQHSGAGELSVAMSYSSPGLEVVIADSGKGFDHTVDWGERLHFGLLGMKERAALIAANLAIDSSAGKGTRVRLTVQRSATLTDSLSL